MEWTIALFVLCSLAGLVMVIGSLLLLWKSRITLSTKSEKMSTIKTPFGVEIATQYPVLIMFFFGVCLLVYPIYQDKNICKDKSLHDRVFPDMVAITGNVKAPTGIDVYAVVDVQDNVHDAVALAVPFRKDARYRILFSANNQVLDSDSFILDKLAPVTLRDRNLQVSTPAAPAIGLTAAVQKVSLQEQSIFKKPEEQK